MPYAACLCYTCTYATILKYLLQATLLRLGYKIVLIMASRNYARKNILSSLSALQWIEKKMLDNVINFCNSITSK